MLRMHVIICPLQIVTRNGYGAACKTVNQCWTSAAFHQSHNLSRIWRVHVVSACTILLSYAMGNKRNLYIAGAFLHTTHCYINSSTIHDKHAIIIGNDDLFQPYHFVEIYESPRYSCACSCSVARCTRCSDISQKNSSILHGYTNNAYNYKKATWLIMYEVSSEGLIAARICIKI